MTTKFPGESAEYRQARDRLLDAEIALRRSTEQVAAARRALPPGGPLADDYVFADDAGHVRMSELFGAHPTLVVYNFMYGPQMEQPCGSCTSILDSLEGAAPHLAQRVALVAVAKSPMRRLREFADRRGWRKLRLVSSASNSYNRDYFGEDAAGEQWPMLNVFHRGAGGIRHVWGCELLYAPEDPGQDGRHVDFLWPVWGVLDVTPEGRGIDWNPQVSYDTAVVAGDVDMLGS